MAKFVFAFANSYEVPLCSLVEEYEGVAEIITNQELKNDSVLIPFATYDKIRKAITHETQIFHFAGHGYSDKIGLLNKDLTTEIILSKLISDIFSGLDSKLKLIFLNGCKTVGLKDSLSFYADRLILTNTVIGDETAARFSIDFYENYFLRNNNLIHSFNKSYRYISSNLGNTQLRNPKKKYSKRSNWFEDKDERVINLDSNSFCLFHNPLVINLLFKSKPNRDKFTLGNIEFNDYYDMFIGIIYNLVNECKDSMSVEVYNAIVENNDNPDQVFRAFKSDLPFSISYSLKSLYIFLLQKSGGNDYNNKEAIILYVYQIYFSFLYNLIYYLTSSIWSFLQEQDKLHLHEPLKNYLKQLYLISNEGEIDFNLFQKDYIEKIRGIINFLEENEFDFIIEENDLLFGLDFGHLLKIESEIQNYISMKLENGDNEKMRLFILDKDLEKQFESLGKFSTVLKWMLKIELICVSDIKLRKNRVIKNEEYFFRPTPLIHDLTREKAETSNDKYPDSNAILMIEKNIHRIKDDKRDFRHALNLTPFIFDKNKDEPNKPLIDPVFLYKASINTFGYFSIKDDSHRGILDKYLKKEKNSYFDSDHILVNQDTPEIKSFISSLLDNKNLLIN